VSYRVYLTRTAEKQLKRLPAEIQRKVTAVLVSLEIEPRPFGCVKLSGRDFLHRVRIGDYRIIYDIIDKEVTVTVLKVGHRKEVYT